MKFKLCFIGTAPPFPAIIVYPPTQRRREDLARGQKKVQMLVFRRGCLL